MLAIGYDEIETLPPIGKTVKCWICKKFHTPEEAVDSDGVPSGMYFFKCGKAMYMCGINGKEWRPHKK